MRMLVIMAVLFGGSVLRANDATSVYEWAVQNQMFKMQPLVLGRSGEVSLSSTQAFRDVVGSCQHDAALWTAHMPLAWEPLQRIRIAIANWIERSSVFLATFIKHRRVIDFSDPLLGDTKEQTRLGDMVRRSAVDLWLEATACVQGKCSAELHKRIRSAWDQTIADVRILPKVFEAMVNTYHTALANEAKGTATPWQQHVIADMQSLFHTGDSAKPPLSSFSLNLEYPRMQLAHPIHGVEVTPEQVIWVAHHACPRLMFAVGQESKDMACRCRFVVNRSDLERATAAAVQQPPRWTMTWNMDAKTRQITIAMQGNVGEDITEHGNGDLSYPVVATVFGLGVAHVTESFSVSPGWLSGWKAVLDLSRNSSPCTNRWKNPDVMKQNPDLAKILFQEVGGIESALSLPDHLEWVEIFKEKK